MNIKEITQRYKVTDCDLRQLFNKGIEDYGLSDKVAGNVMRAVLGACFGEIEVFTSRERAEMKTAGAMGFFQEVTEQLKQADRNIYMIN